MGEASLDDCSESKMITLVKIEEILNEKKMLLEFFKKLEECLKAIREIRMVVTMDFDAEKVSIGDRGFFKNDKGKVEENCFLIEKSPEKLIPWIPSTAIFSGLKRLREYYFKAGFFLPKEKEEKLNEAVKIASDFIVNFLREANGIWRKIEKEKVEENEKIKKGEVIALLRKWLKDYEQKQKFSEASSFSRN